MLGKLLNLNKLSSAVGADELASLHPFLRSSAELIENAASLADRVELKPGVVNGELALDQPTFLRRGELQLQTKTGFLLHLYADSAQATLPLPPRSMLASLYAAEPCSLIVLPASALPERPARPVTAASRPELTDQESDALAQLHNYFKTDRCELPSLPDLAMKIGKAIDDPDTDNDDIARLIQLDPSLTARLLSVVNSAAFGGIQKITGIQQATARLGRKKVRSLVYSCMLKSMFKANARTLNACMETLWHEASHVAALSFVLGRQTPGIDPEQALLAGLIHDIGAVAVIGGVSKFPVLADREEVLRYAIDSLRVAIGVKTLHEWRLADEFQDVIRYSGDWQHAGTAIPDNTDVVMLARLHSLIGSSEQAGLPRIDEVAAFSKLARGELSPRQSLAILDEAEADVREVRALISGT